MLKVLKNLNAYRVIDQAQMEIELPQGETFSELLERALAANAYQPIHETQARRWGWVPLHDDAPGMAFETAGFRVLRMRATERHLPKSAIDEVVAERCAEHLDIFGFMPARRGKMEIKERVVEELMPRAFPISRHVDIWWRHDGVMIVDAGSDKRAEQALDLLRETLGSLKSIPMAPMTPAGRTMTTWLRDPETRPNGVTVGDVVKLRAKGDDGVLNAKHIDPDGEEVRMALEVGRQVQMMELTLEERATFKLDEGFRFKAVRFADAVADECDKIEAEEGIDRLAADVHILGSAAFQVVDVIMQGLGGEAQIKPKESVK